ncbi:MAG: hypothetical protein JOY71_15185 [Acetobacteraceae bacterium]|nr:hypothetical protein [Acetobacteraceae bacterium]MBV8523443.1 hypothetical protein [Acetobacteraceae bacterium]MBV8590024.1 hypothetical protein [Acetobacteraceae bacterium]
MNTIDSVSDRASDTREQIARLREQVEMLMRERVTPALADAAGRAENAARAVTDTVSEQAEAISGRVREQPLIAVLVAAGIGYLIGRITR